MKIYRDAFVRDDIYSAAATSVVARRGHPRRCRSASCGWCRPAPSGRSSERPARRQPRPPTARAHRPPDRAPGRRAGRPILPTAGPAARRALLPAAGRLGADRRRPRATRELFTTFTFAPGSVAAGTTSRDLSAYRGGLFWRWMLNTALYAGVGALLSAARVRR